MDSLTVTQAAATLGVDARTIRRRLDSGEMKGERVTARLWVIPKREIERWRAAGDVKRKAGRPRKAPPA